MPVPHYTANVSDGWLTVRTSQATLRYRVGSGPFTRRQHHPALRRSGGRTTTRSHPTWEWECPFDQTCQSGAAALGGRGRAQPEPGRLPEHRRLRGLPRRPGSRHHLDRARARRPAGRCWPSATRTSPLRRLHRRPEGSTSWWTVTWSPPCRPRRPQPPTRGPRSPPPPRCGPAPTRCRWSATRASTASSACQTLSDNFNLGIDSLSIGPARAPPRSRGRPTRWADGSAASTPTPTDRAPPALGSSGATCQTAIEPLHTDGLLDRRRVAAAGRHPERGVDARWLGAAPSRGRRRRGRLPLRLRPRLHRRPAHLRPADRTGTAAAAQHVRGLVLGLHPVLQCRPSNTRSIPRS